MRRRLKSFWYAWQGAKVLLATQPNARIHGAATVIVLAAGCYFRVGRHDWALLAFAIGLVWTTEAMNTAIEFLADEITLEKRELIKRAKDVAAFGVLASAVTALMIGLLVFAPHLGIL